MFGSAGQAGVVGLFAGCVGSTLFGRVNRFAARILAYHGFQTHTPAGQVCCGALQWHSGDREGARSLAKRNVEAFAQSGSGEILVAAAGCGAVLKEYGELLDGVPAAVSFSSRVRDIRGVCWQRFLELNWWKCPIRTAVAAVQERIRSGSTKCPCAC